eukprot:459542_1
MSTVSPQKKNEKHVKFVDSKDKHSTKENMGSSIALSNEVYDENQPLKYAYSNPQDSIIIQQEEEKINSAFDSPIPNIDELVETVSEINDIKRKSLNEIEKDYYKKYNHSPANIKQIFKFAQHNSSGWRYSDIKEWWDKKYNIMDNNKSKKKKNNNNKYKSKKKQKKSYNNSKKIK